jgi:hypothetical protein
MQDATLTLYLETQDSYSFRPKISDLMFSRCRYIYIVKCSRYIHVEQNSFTYFETDGVEDFCTVVKVREV